MSHSVKTLNTGLSIAIVLLLAGIVWSWTKTSSEEIYKATPTSSPISALPTSTKTPTPKPSPVRVEPSAPRPPTNSSAPNPEPVTSALKEEVRLVVPFTSQAPERNWDEPWQNACEEAALLMLDAYYKKYQLSPLFSRDELLKILAYEDTLSYGGSIDIEKIKKVAIEAVHLDKHGTVKIIENPTVGDIKKYIAAGNPVLVVADGKKLPNPNFTNGGPTYHALIITGYTAGTFITNDPGTRLGEDFVYQIDDLMNAIRDWNGGNVKQGRRAILVVE